MEDAARTSAYLSRRVRWLQGLRESPSRVRSQFAEAQPIGLLRCRRISRRSPQQRGEETQSCRRLLYRPSDNCERPEPASQARASRDGELRIGVSLRSEDYHEDTPRLPTPATTRQRSNCPAQLHQAG